jgi:acetyl-CoA acetyltransferase
MTDPKIAIVGIGETPVGKLPEWGSLRLHAEATYLALEDAGLTLEDIDGVVTAGSRLEGFLMHSAAYAEYLGILPRYSNTMGLGGASHCAAIRQAGAAIEGGLASTVLVASGDNLATGMSRQRAVENLSKTGAGHPEFENPYGPPIPALYALIASRHMHEYGTQPEQLAAVAVTMREHASRNSHAHKRDLITVDDVLESKMIATPLHMLDCSLISDGGGAFILTNTDLAKDIRSDSVFVLGTGEAHTGEHVTMMPNLTQTGARYSGEQAFTNAGLTTDQIDVAMLYDSFTIAVLLQLEDLGFCKKGEAGAFTANGELELDGALPTNTHGGCLSHGHPGKPGGIFHIIEAVRQLRNEAGDRQVPDARTALVHGSGGALATHNTVILGV